MRIHIHQRRKITSGICYCGAHLCLSKGPGRALCMLIKGHEGYCKNPNFPDRGKWLNTHQAPPTAPQPPREVLDNFEEDLQQVYPGCK